MGKSEIEWTDWSWNILGGCTERSPGCTNCYARRMSWRMMHNPKAPARYQGTVAKVDGDLRWTGRVNLDWEALVDPEPLRMTMPKRIFVASMSDLFHEDVSGGFLFEVFEVMRLAPQHTYMILTKRPERVLSFYRRSDDSTWRSEVFTDNIWFGATIEDQARADERTPISMEIPTAVRFVSIEPMLGPVDLRHVQTQDVEIDALTGNHGVKRPLAGRSDRRLDWVICGGETGPGARPMHPDWVRSLRDQCREAGVPFFFKSWGDWVPSDQAQAPSGLHEPGRWHGWDSGLFSYRVGKAKAGRVLDGEVWDEMPGMETGS